MKYNKKKWQQSKKKKNVKKGIQKKGKFYHESQES